MGTLWHYYDIGVDLMKWATCAYVADFVSGDIMAVLGLPIAAIFLLSGWLIALMWPLLPMALLFELFGMPVLSGPYRSGRTPHEKISEARRPVIYSTAKSLLSARLAAPVAIVVATGAAILLLDLLGVR